MFYITGRISGKKPMKSGTNQNGNWKIIVFSITKRIHRVQEHFWFTATGKKAELVLKLHLNDKVDIEFAPVHKIKGDHVYTENVVKEITLSAKMPSWDDTNEVDEPVVEFTDSLNIQAIIEKNEKEKNKNRATEETVKTSQKDSVKTKTKTKQKGSVKVKTKATKKDSVKTKRNGVKKNTQEKEIHAN